MSGTVKLTQLIAEKDKRIAELEHQRDIKDKRIAELEDERDIFQRTLNKRDERIKELEDKAIRYDLDEE